MNRRNFFKKLGKVALIVPFIPKFITEAEEAPKFIRTNVRKTLSTGKIECRTERYDPPTQRWKPLPSAQWRKINEGVANDILEDIPWKKEG